MAREFEYVREGETLSQAMDRLANDPMFRFEVFKARVAEIDAADAWTPEARECAQLTLEDIHRAAEGGE